MRLYVYCVWFSLVHVASGNVKINENTTSTTWTRADALISCTGVRTYKRGTVNRWTINRVSLNRGHIIAYNTVIQEQTYYGVEKGTLLQNCSKYVILNCEDGVWGVGLCNATRQTCGYLPSSCRKLPVHIGGPAARALCGKQMCKGKT